jgi:hypothetical protein
MSLDVITNKKVFIYGLKCPITEKIRYIGKTNNLKDRYSRHINEKKNYHKCLWIKNLKEQGVKPEMVVIDEVDFCNWEEAERKYIMLFKSFGADLTNKTIGGDITPIAIGSKNGNWGKFGELNHRAKSILIFDKNGLFIEEIGSMRQCQNKYSVDFSSIVRCCKGKLKRVGNYMFRYKSDFEKIPNSIQVINKIYKKGKENVLSIPISQYDLKGNFIKSFDSISNSNKETGISISSIRYSLSKKIKSKNKIQYEFRYNKN